MAGGGGMHGRGVCMAKGHVWQGGLCCRGACMLGACVAGRACVAGETVTITRGTHPTGMHSC